MTRGEATKGSEGNENRKAQQLSSQHFHILQLITLKACFQWHGILHWLIQASCPSCVVSNSFAHPRALTEGGDRARERENLAALQILFSNSQNTGLVTNLKHSTLWDWDEENELHLWQLHLVFSRQELEITTPAPRDTAELNWKQEIAQKRNRSYKTK